MKKSILGRLIRLVSTLLIMMTIMIGVLFAVIFSKQTEDLHMEEVSHRGEIIQNTLADYFSGETLSSRMGSGQNNHSGMMGYGTYLNFINQIAGDYVWVVDQNKQALLNSHHGNTTDQELPEAANQLIESVYLSKSSASIKEGGLFQLSSITMVLPILVENQVVGIVVMYSDVASIHQNQANGYLILLISMLIALLISILLLIRLARDFVSPIREMENYTDALINEKYPPALKFQTEDELNELAERLSILSKRLEQAKNEQENKIRGEKEFLSQISHELRTPVMVMKSSLEALTDELVTSQKELKLYHQQLLKEAGCLERLVNDLLELSRLQSVEFSLNMESVDPLEIIEDAVRAYRWKLKEKGQVLKIDNQLTEPVYIYGDHVRLTQLMKNLLDNANKYSNNNSEILLSIEKIKNQLCFKLKNQSGSINPIDSQALFETFHRGNRINSEEGTGLGLAICQQIIQRHSGEITIDNESGCQVVVTFYLPIENTR
ncbi:sensor histidine kinase [Enterococcus sp. CWB-B31]|uniref:sensor histidine kinase n=1 Tax=Enterococcus sp. CWB-B31 TaxID=2885159 RepID=UPI001E4D6CDC|nr:HAMP domain-containing sensor histidine kinase [Enterococcus sp. CWB-B31]MCB5953538.1 HAMP domain-containing histidine kinase [Enterococcus sp. CWB-B31]